MAKPKEKKSVKKTQVRAGGRVKDHILPVKKQVSKKTKEQNNQDDSKLFAFIATFFTIIGFIIALIIRKENEYVMFYAKQGLVLFIAQLILIVLTPFLFFLTPILWILWVILWIIAWINSLSGEMKNTFIIGDLAEKIKL